MDQLVYSLLRLQTLAFTKRRKIVNGKKYAVTFFLSVQYIHLQLSVKPIAWHAIEWLEVILLVLVVNSKRDLGNPTLL